MQTEQVKTNGHATPKHEPAKEIPIGKLVESKFNPRKTFDEKKLAELGESVRVHGVLEDLLVRPVAGGHYEIVFGARRFRAAKIAKVESVPCKVRPLDDIEALELAIVENSQREDVHPLEEAEGYEMLHKKHGLTVEAIALKVNKSPSSVYQRMKLCALCKEGREAVYAGTIHVTVALAIARIPNAKLQAEAVAELAKCAKELKQDLEQFDCQERADGKVKATVDDAKTVDPLSERLALRVIRNRFMLRLADAPFDVKDTTLTKAPACATCPNRTGNQATLFADVKSADVCTLLTCFNEKRDAAWKRRVASAEKDGVSVLSDAAAKQTFRDDRLNYDSKYIDLDVEGYIGTTSTTYRKKLGNKLPPITIARDADGNIHELVEKSAIEKPRASTSSTKLSKADKKRRAEEKAAKQKADTKNAIERKCTELAIVTMVEKAKGKAPTTDFWRALVVGFLDDGQVMSSDIADALVERGLVKDCDAAYDLDSKAIERMIASLSEKTCRSLLVQIVALRAAFEDFGTRVELRKRSAFDMLCDFYKVDPKKFTAEAKASIGGAA